MMEGAAAMSAIEQQPDQLLTVGDVAGIIGAHESTVRHWIRSGELKASRFGSRIGYRIRRGDYEAFLAQRSLKGVITAQLLRGSFVGGES